MAILRTAGNGRRDSDDVPPLQLRLYLVNPRSLFIRMLNVSKTKNHILTFQCTIFYNSSYLFCCVQIYVLLCSAAWLAKGRISLASSPAHCDVQQMLRTPEPNCFILRKPGNVSSSLCLRSPVCKMGVMQTPSQMTMTAHA